MPKTTPEQNKVIVLEAFNTLFNKRDYAAGTFLVTEVHPQVTAPKRAIVLKINRTRRYEL
jgi:hypothetical protein